MESVKIPDWVIERYVQILVARDVQDNEQLREVVKKQIAKCVILIESLGGIVIWKKDENWQPPVLINGI